MPKYYISSGDFQKVLSSPDHTTAAYDAFNKLKEDSPKNLGLITIVSEHGFDSCVDEDYCFSTLHLLEDTDQLQNYKLDNWIKDFL